MCHLKIIAAGVAYTYRCKNYF